MKLEVFLKSGQSFIFECETFKVIPGGYEWINAGEKNKLINLEPDSVAAVVRRSD